MSLLRTVMLLGFLAVTLFVSPLFCAAQPATTTLAPAPASVAVVEKVDLNTADAIILESKLVGIGKKKAQAIVDYRTAKGPFTSIEQVMNVPGIGKKTFEANKEKISVSTPSQPATGTPQPAPTAPQPADGGKGVTPPKTK